MNPRTWCQRQRLGVWLIGSGLYGALSSVACIVWLVVTR